LSLVLNSLLGLFIFSWEIGYLLTVHMQQGLSVMNNEVIKEGILVTGSATGAYLPVRSSAPNGSAGW